ncbi:hypothetical protein GCM10011583_03650 [Streptomyces camponoticapitis]|uniref:Uncharacterized protein n=1 Tax=Streptomyces camponoticapitis TaxID=1616125 RepID=A0ABQ2DW37_9ACTN|nr:hypothetical protein GCM10011583_03650 [Streptomyces camponoticapitis]
MVPVFFTVHEPSKPVPQSDFLVYVAVADVAASAGEARPTMAARGRRSAVSAATDLDLNLVLRTDVFVLKGYSSSEFGAVRGWSGWSVRPDFRDSSRTSQWRESKEVWTNRQ